MLCLSLAAALIMQTFQGVISADEGYSPSYAVRTAHNFPHLKLGFPIEKASSSFEPDNRDYQYSIAFLPAIILAVGVLAILFTYVIFPCCCCQCCKVVDVVKEEETEITESRLHKIVFRRRLAIGAFFTFIVLIVAANNEMWFYGNDKITDGMKTTVDAFNYMDNYTNFLLYYGSNITSYADDIDTSVDAAVSGGCTEADELYPMVSAMKYGVGNFSEILDPIPGAIDTIIDNTEEYGFDLRNKYMWFAYLFLWVVPGLYVLGLLCRSKAAKMYLHGVMLLGALLVLAITLICCVWMVVVALFGDFCMEPTTNTLAYLEDMSFYDTAAYFLSCTGTNPLEDPADTINEQVEDITYALNQLVYNSSSPAACQNNADLIDAISFIDAANGEVTNIFSQLNCTNIQNVWEQLVHEGFCTDAFTGIFGLWAGLFACAWCLYFLNVVSSVLVQYFDTIMWNIGDPKFTLLPFDDSHEVLYESNVGGEGEGDAASRDSDVAPSAPPADDDAEFVGHLELAPFQRPQDAPLPVDGGPGALPTSPPAVNRSKWSLV